MGILADFVIADSDAGRSIGESTSPADTWPTLESNGVDTVMLATLYCCISGLSYSVELEESFETAGGDEKNGPWVFRFPSDILCAISNLATQDIGAIAAKWAATEELQMQKVSDGEAEAFITMLHAHAQRACKSGQAMFLRMSL